MSRMMVPLRLNLELRFGERGRETERRCEMRAPQSWPQRMMGCGALEDGRMEWRVKRIACPVADLVCAMERGEERP
jgi:hypothetical protein